MTSLFANLSDVTLLLAAIGAGTYCFVLSRRLSRLSSIDKGLGGAIAVLSAQVDDMTNVLAEARNGSDRASADLQEKISLAEKLVNDLEIMMAAFHDLPIDEGSTNDPPTVTNSQQSAELNAHEQTIPDPAPVTFGSSRINGDETKAYFRHRHLDTDAVQ